VAKRKLLFSITKKDFEISYFSGKGGGGQHRNRHMNCCRIKHPASGAIATGQSCKSKVQNTRAALHSLVEQPKFKVWHAKKVAEIKAKKSTEELIKELMAPENLKIEMLDESERWVSYKEDSDGSDR